MGNYTFTQLSTGNTDPSITPGVSVTGLYQVVLAPSSSIKQTSTTPSPVLISAGGTNINNVDFTVISSTPQPPPPPQQPPTNKAPAPNPQPPVPRAAPGSTFAISLGGNALGAPFSTDNNLIQLVD